MSCRERLYQSIVDYIRGHQHIRVTTKKTNRIIFKINQKRKIFVQGRLKMHTLSTTITAIDPLFVNVSTILSKFSAESGCETRRSSVFTPIDSASKGHIAFSTSR